MRLVSMTRKQHGSKGAPGRGSSQGPGFLYCSAVKVAAVAFKWLLTTRSREYCKGLWESTYQQ